MKKIFLSGIGLILLFSIFLSACTNKDIKQIEAAKKELTSKLILKDNKSENEVISNLNLPDKINEVILTYSSNNLNVISITGEVKRANSDEIVKITALLKRGKESSTKEFTFKVLAKAANNVGEENNNDNNNDKTPDDKEQQTTTITQSFDESKLSENYGSGTYSDATGINWTYSNARNTQGHQIDGGGIMLRGNHNGDAYLEANLDAKITDFSFKYKKAFTSPAERKYAIDFIVEGKGTKTFQFSLKPKGNAAEDDIYEFKLSEQSGFNLSDFDGAVKVKIYHLGDKNAQIVINNISWNKKQ